MQWKSMTPWLALFILSTSSSAQEKAEAVTLQRALRTFEAVDSNKDQALIFGELKRAGLSQKSFRKFDADASGSWSEADFLLYYEQLLKRSKRGLSAPFQEEIARIKTRRDPEQEPAATSKAPAQKAKKAGKAVLAVPEKSEPFQKPAPVAKRRPGQPAPAVVLDPDSVPVPKDGTFQPQVKPAKQRTDLAPQSLLDRAQEAQRRHNEKRAAANKRTPG